MQVTKHGCNLAATSRLLIFDASRRGAHGTGDRSATDPQGVTLNTIKSTARRVAGIATVSAIAITGLAGTALAQSTAFADTHGDMKQGADIRKVRVTNGEEVLRVNVRHRDLVKSFRSGSSIAVFIDTDAERTGPEYVFQGATFEGGDYALLPAAGFKADGNRQVPLRGGSYIMKLDYVEDVARIAIDQVVVGSPEQVRVEVKTGAELLPAGSTTPGENEVDWLGTPKSFTPYVAKG